MYVSAVALHVHRFSLVTAIPALVALVHDLFVVRASNKPTDVSKDVDTQREVLISMLLKLTQHYQVLEMFIIVLAGASLGMGALGIGWSNIQWLAAALTFGLAFGLQESLIRFV